MYDNIGGKIKGLATAAFIVEAIASFIGAIAFMSMDSDYALVGLLIMIVGPLVAYVSSWLLYGYGKLIESAENIEKKLSENKIKKTSVVESDELPEI